MSKSLNYKVKKNKNPKVKTYTHFFQLETNLSYKYVGNIINNLLPHYNYNPETGFLVIQFLIPQKVRGRKNRILTMYIFVKKSLSNKQLDEILISNSFKYNVDTGVLDIIHKIVYP